MRIAGIITAMIAISMLILTLVPGPVSAEQLISNVSPSEDYSVLEGEPAIFTVELLAQIDETQATIQWYKDGSPVIGDGLKFSFTPGFDEAGTYKVTVIVVYNATSDSHDWNLTVLDVKERFNIASASPDGDVNMDEGEKGTFAVMVNNPAKEILKYHWYVDDQYHFGINRSNFAFEAGLDDQGERIVKVVVESIDHTEEHEWKVTVMDSIEIMPVGDVEILEGRSMEFKVLTTGIQDHDVIWFLDGSTGSTGTGRSFYYSPDHDDAGVHTLTLNTSSGDGHEWRIKVIDVNRPPTVAVGKVRKATVGQSATFEGVASDPDHNIIRYEWDFDGDAEFDYSSDRQEVTKHTYKKPGVYLATYKVTDAGGETAVTTYQYVVSEPASLSGWGLASMVMGFLIVLMFGWMVLDRHKERMRSRREATRMASIPMRTTERPKDDEVPTFEDIVEEDEEVPPEDLVMVPYESKMADRDMEAEGDADETEITVDGRPEVDRVAPTAEDLEKVGEKFTEDEKQEIDDILASLTARALGKTDLTSKKASAEVGAQDTDTEIGIGPKSRSKRRKKKKASKGTKRSKPKVKKEEAVPEDKTGVSKGAESDLEAEQSDVDLIMKDLIDKGLAERRDKKKTRRR